MKTILEPVYETKYKPKQNKAMLEILQQIEHEENNVMNNGISSSGAESTEGTSSPPPGVSSSHFGQPVSSNGKSGSDYPPLHELSINGYSQSSTVPVQSSNNSEHRAERKVPSILAGPNVPTPNYWPSQMNGSEPTTTDSVPPYIRHGHMVLNGGSVEVDSLNQPVTGAYRPRTDVPLMGFNHSGGSNIAIASMSPHISCDGGGSTPPRGTRSIPDSSTTGTSSGSGSGLMEAGGDPRRAAENSVPEIENRRGLDAPVQRFTVTDP